MNYQEEYFRAIYSDFQSKARLFAGLISDRSDIHNNVLERAVTELLRMMLPERYSIGSGFVIDSENSRSCQCDIIIYDALTSFGIFGYGGQFLFPVESVYAVIEVEKTLNKEGVQQACDNIASVRRLKSVASSEYKWVVAENGTLEPREYYAKSPAGIVFSYQSETRRLLTIKGWFEQAFQKIQDTAYHPDLAISMLEGFKFRYKTTSHRADSQEFKFYPVSWRAENGALLRGNDGSPTGIFLPEKELDNSETEYVGLVGEFNHNRYCKFVQRSNEENLYAAGDDARLLMTTLSSIARLLSFRVSTENLLEEYFSPYFAEAIRI